MTMVKIRVPEKIIRYFCVVFVPTRTHPKSWNENTWFAVLLFAGNWIDFSIHVLIKMVSPPQNPPQTRWLCLHEQSQCKWTNRCSISIVAQRQMKNDAYLSWSNGFSVWFSLSELMLFKSKFVDFSQKSSNVKFCNANNKSQYLRRLCSWQSFRPHLTCINLNVYETLM